MMAALDVSESGGSADGLPCICRRAAMHVQPCATLVTMHVQPCTHLVAMHVQPCGPLVAMHMQPCGPLVACPAAQSMPALYFFPRVTHE